ncbi:MAG: hypothetical protein J6S58_09230 [Lentisphaeria bacterium]|nr:hypothetical protein [Lentisphaeria bacterium]
MSALTSNRNTAEILCHAEKFHRLVPVKSSCFLYVGAIGAIDTESGKAEPAADQAGLVVAGRVEGFSAGGKAIIKSGVFKYDNGTDEEKVTLNELNKTVYILDDHTFGRLGGTHKIRGGVLRDIDSDGQLIVEIGTLTLD